MLHLPPPRHSPFVHSRDDKIFSIPNTALKKKRLFFAGHAHTTGPRVASVVAVALRRKRERQLYSINSAIHAEDGHPCRPIVRRLHLYGAFAALRAATTSRIHGRSQARQPGRRPSESRRAAGQGRRVLWPGAGAEELEDLRPCESTTAARAPSSPLPSAARLTQRSPLARRTSATRKAWPTRAWLTDSPGKSSASPHAQPAGPALPRLSLTTRPSLRLARTGSRWQVRRDGPPPARDARDAVALRSAALQGRLPAGHGALRRAAAAAVAPVRPRAPVPTAAGLSP